MNRLGFPESIGWMVLFFSITFISHSLPIVREVLSRVASVSVPGVLLPLRKLATSKRNPSQGGRSTFPLCSPSASCRGHLELPWLHGTRPPPARLLPLKASGFLTVLFEVCAGCFFPFPCVLFVFSWPSFILLAVSPNWVDFWKGSVGQP